MQNKKVLKQRSFKTFCYWCGKRDIEQASSLRVATIKKTDVNLNHFGSHLLFWCGKRDVEQASSLRVATIKKQM